MLTTRSKDGTTLAYDVTGSGPALVYITGAICYRDFKPIVDDSEKFGEEFAVYTYDRRGRGDSGDTPPYALEREIEDLEAIIDAAGGSAFLYGHSSGAVLALEAALRIPRKVSKVVLFDAPYVHDEKEKAKYALLRQKILSLLGKGKGASALRAFLIGIGMPRIFAYLLPVMPGWQTMKALAPTLEYDLLLTSDLPPVGRAAEIKVPTQIIYGGKSPASIHSVAKQLAEAIPGSRLEELAGQNHMVAAQALLPLLSSFLKN